MKATLDKSKMNHLKGESSYNRNIFSYGNSGMKILEICHEDYNFYEYKIIDEDNEVLLGCSEEQFKDIELLTYFT